MLRIFTRLFKRKLFDFMKSAFFLPLQKITTVFPVKLLFMHMTDLGRVGLEHEYELMRRKNYG